MESSEFRDFRPAYSLPDCAEPVIGRAFARPVGFIRATTTCPSCQCAALISSPNHNYIHRCPVPKRGDTRSSRTRDGMRWTRMAPLTNALEGAGKVVWSSRLDAGVKLAVKTPPATVARKPDRRGEREISRKTIAQGMPDCLR